MNGARRAWQVAAWFCWAVTLLIVLRPINIDVADNDDSVPCGRVFEAALTAEYEPCAVKGSRRLDTLALWVVLTAPVTLGYLTSRPRRPQATDVE